MTNHDTQQLSAYLDGQLTAAGRQRVEAHLRDCPACRQVLQDLTAILRAAPSYEGAPPARDLWPEIAAGIDRARVVPLAPRRAPRLFTWRQLVAASALLAAAASGAVWLATRGSPPPLQEARALRSAEPGVRLAGLDARADAAYDTAVSDLEQVLAAGRDRLDTATVRVLEQSLATIDRAIAEARAAIVADPANAWLSAQMAANMRRKLDLLRRAAAAVEAAQL